MKKNTFRAALSVLLVLCLAVMIAPQVALADDASATVVYDDRYVSMTGSDGTGNGLSETTAWRTITHAESQLPFGGVNPDRILVLPSNPNQYGGPANSENLVVDKPVTIKSTDGAGPVNDPMTAIDLTGQGGPDQVIEIVSSNVTIDGLFLAGASVGIWAHGPDVGPPIENVTVKNCIIKVDQVENGTGIEMMKVKHAVIDNNEIYVGTEGAGLALSVTYAWGILMSDCFNATVINNLINVHGDMVAIGIEMDLCPKSLVGVEADGTSAPNIINVLAAGDVVGVGIKVTESPLIDVDYNVVTVETNGEWWGIAFGIKVKQSDRADVIGNTVTVDNNMVGGSGGFLMAMGIWVKMCHESNVNSNIVEVTGVGNIVDTEVDGVNLTLDDEADLEDIDEILLPSLGNTLNVAGGIGVVIGIKVSSSEYVMVNGNDVDVRLGLDFVAADEDFANGCGNGVAMGIKAIDAPGIKVMGNDVDVQRAVAPSRPHDVMVFIKVHAIEATTAEFGGGGGIAIALGIVLAWSPGMISQNNVSADGDLKVEIKSVPNPGYLEEGSALSRLDSEIVGAIYQSLIETIQSETMEVQLSGNPPTIESMAGGGGIAAGIGIMVLESHGTKVTGNAPVIGIGDLRADVVSQELPGDPGAAAMGGGMGLGIGITVINSMSVEVSGNGNIDDGPVKGMGIADVFVGAKHGSGAVVVPTDTCAKGGGAGIGIGILLCGLPQFRAEAEELPEGQHWAHRPVVSTNVVEASGVAMIDIDAVDLVVSHDSMALGGGLGLGLGIASVFYPWILISNNTVGAIGDTEVDIYSEAVHTFDPVSIGGAAGIGIGITTVGAPGPQIIDNMSSGQGTALADVGATEKVIMDTGAFGGSLGLGEGILVFDCCWGLVKGNSMAYGVGDAETNVIAESYIPLKDAYALSLAAGIGKGIAVICSPKTDVVECNTAAGEGTARVEATADADFDYDGALGLAADLDILVSCLHLALDEEADASWGGFFGRVNYNSMVDTTDLGDNDGPVMVIDAGLLKLGFPCLNAKFNWWNHATGPSGSGPGNGEPVLWIGMPVKFEPWLYVEHTEVLEEQLGKFGFYIKMCKGLNTLSTPIALEQNVVSSRTWGDIAANSGLAGKVKYVIRWDDAAQQWEDVLPATTLDPLDAWYIYMYDECDSVILMVNVDPGHPYAMPTRTLATGWGLIGPNPIFDESYMPVDEALTSIELTPDGLQGYTQAISPVVGCQPAWYYVPDMDPEDMLSGRGYWVWMENGDILVGFGFTPLPDQL
jgi:hypothetical protein